MFNNTVYWEKYSKISTHTLLAKDRKALGVKIQ